MELEFEFQEHDMKSLLNGMVDGSLDVAVAALTITQDREGSFDFSHPFHSTGLSIATLSKYGNPWIAVFKRFFSTAFMKIVASLVFLLLIVGVFLWWFERKKNPKQFGGKIIQGIGSGFWWSAVTMTTVGYGDKAPVTFWGRILAIIWMFAGIIIISSFTAAITSALTVGHLESIIKGPEDLPKVRVGTIINSTSEAFLREKNLSYSKYNTLLEGLQEVADGKIDAVVYDAPILRYLVKKKFWYKMKVLPNTFVRQDYGIALPEGSSLREPINRALLKEIHDPKWQETLYNYLGKK